MQKELCLIAAALCGAVLCAQTQSPEPAPQVLKPHSYVRRISIGASLSVEGISAVPKNSSHVVSTSPAVDSTYTSSNASQRIGYGITLQLAVWRRFAVVSGIFMRRFGYQMDSDIYQGIDNPTTPKDDRTHINNHEDTHARVFDVPVLLRYYGRDRTEKGPHWFIEGGIAGRRATHARTSVSTALNEGNWVCCTVGPANLAQSSATGLVAGAGVQLIDPVGIRVVPEVRYTHWRAPIFNVFSSTSRADQVEAMISLTF
jgi:hypothetical protein